MAELQLETAHYWARQLGESDKAIRRALDGIPPDGVRGEKQPRYFLSTVFAALLAQRAPQTRSDEFDDQRQRLAAAQAEKHEMENSLRRGELADSAKVQAAWSEHISAARAKLLSMPTKLGPQLTRVADPNIVSARIRAEVYAAINELAEWELPEPDGVAGGDAPPDPAAMAEPTTSKRKRVGRPKQEAELRK